MNVKRVVDYDVLLLTALIWFLGKFLRYAFPPLFEPLQGSYGVSNAAIGTAFTGFMIVYALMQFPSGALADRVGAVRVIVAGVAVAGLGALALVADSPFAVLVAAMLVIGGGTGAHKTVAVRLLSRVYPSRTGRALGAHDTFGAFGGVVAPAAIVLFVSAPPALAVLLARLPGADWRGLFLVSGLVALALAATFLLRVPKRLPDDADRGVETEGPEPGTRDYLTLFRDVRFSAFVLVTIAFSFAYNGTVAFLPLYLSQEAGLATTTASLLYSALFAVTFVQLLSGDVSDRVGRFPVMVVSLGLAAAALVGVVLLAGAGAITLGALVIALGLGAHGYRPVRGAYLMEILPDWLAGGGLGVVRTLLMGAGALAPGIVGVVADVSGFRPAFGLLAASMALAAIGAAGLWVTE
ncbi:MFS transporter [Halorubrum sp. JWXQ-INN 858]|uniref:MFS transporter n=1 Tax=Halorubrum sp. JWXQ-INN 858 TaxID=2690782 RepID=UPI00135CDF72|nr:MFS transporter [Halorubrum sp. JWXQ-INN 858]MWV66049.1 MFS transporter [Halorubrum sp. JWXQ-INN 858]